MDARDTPAPPASAAHRRRRPALLALCCSLALAAATFLALGIAWLAGVGGVDTAAVPGAARAAAAVRQSGPAPLTVRVAAPGPVAAGHPVRLDVTYADGSGIFSGSTEDWGDGVGASSLAQDRCGPGTGSAAAVTGSYRAAHTWAKPGTYTVRIAVSSYTCADTEPVEEQATATVTVEVAAS